MLTGLQNIIGLGLIPALEAENEGGGGGGGGGDDFQAKLDEATAGLKTTNADLKKEKKELRERLEQQSSTLEKLGGDEGIENLLKLRDHIENDDAMKLLSEGKHEEWFDKRLQPVKSEYEKRIQTFESEIAKRDEALAGAQSQLHTTLLDVGMSKACDAVEISEAGAKEHARMLAERQFSFDPELNTHVIKDAEGSIVYGKDGKNPKTMTEWLEEKREVPEYRLWWPESRGAGLTNGGMAGNADRRMETLSNMSMSEYREARAKQQKQA